MGRLFILTGIKNKVVFNDHPAFRLRNDFTISYYIRPDFGNVNNNDTDITRKGSTATAKPDSWWKVEIKNNIMQGVVSKDRASRSRTLPEKDMQERRDGLLAFCCIYQRREHMQFDHRRFFTCSIQNQLLDKYRKHCSIGHRGEGY